jgi:hypothetical protein
LKSATLIIAPKRQTDQIMEAEEDLPVFRPFTREELAVVKNRIFENKYAAKKKAKIYSSTIQKIINSFRSVRKKMVIFKNTPYGEGARAREMYENDMDEEEDDDELENEPHPKLAQGNNLPQRYGKFPAHMTSTPICDIDPYYKDKKTFIVISSGAITRFSAGKAIFLLSPFHPIRRIAIRVLVHPVFNLLVIFTILANCYVMIKPESELV